jgi:hypothetical protein
VRIGANPALLPCPPQAPGYSHLRPKGGKTRSGPITLLGKSMSQPKLTFIARRSGSSLIRLVVRLLAITGFALGGWDVASEPLAVQGVWEVAWFFGLASILGGFWFAIGLVGYWRTRPMEDWRQFGNSIWTGPIRIPPENLALLSGLSFLGATVGAIAAFVILPGRSQIFAFMCASLSLAALSSIVWARLYLHVMLLWRTRRSMPAHRQ